MALKIDQDAHILAIDVGTSSIRMMLFDSQAQPLSKHIVQTHYTPEITADAGATLNPEAMCKLIFEGIDRLLQQAGDHIQRVAAVTIDTMVSNLLGVSGNGNPTTPIYTWADARGAEFKEKLALSPDEYIRRTGCRLHTSYWPLRLLWIQANEPEDFKQTAYWLSIGEYVLYRIFGQRRISYSVASWSGLLNRHKLTWDEQTLAALPIKPDQLSQLSEEPFQGLTGEWAKRWPALKDAYWLPVIADGVASNIGMGCVAADRVAISMGTSGALRVILPGQPVRIPDGLFAYCVDRDRTIVGGALSNVGNFYAWMQHTLRAEQDVESKAAQCNPDGHGLTILPFLSGERAPDWNDNARAAFIGMTLDTRPEHVIRAGLEAVAYRFYQVMALLRPLLPAVPGFIAGGAAIGNSPLWGQIMADVLGSPIEISADPESTIRGTVLWATGKASPLQHNQRYSPNPEHHIIYQRAIERQQALYNRLVK